MTDNEENAKYKPPKEAKKQKKKKSLSNLRVDQLRSRSSRTIDARTRMITSWLAGSMVQVNTPIFRVITPSMCVYRVNELSKLM